MVNENKLRQIFSRYQSLEDWKNPVDAIVYTKKDALLLKKAIEFYQGDVAKIKKVIVPTRHKEGLVWMQGSAFHVTSKGYQAY
jgi:hypothetical protein